ncbi:MAG: hypothetical protein ACI8TX_000650 [Hyphomicrobiaceae bacterium]|jgi:hypothetical protein
MLFLRKFGANPGANLIHRAKSSTKTPSSPKKMVAGRDENTDRVDEGPREIA